MSGYMSGVLAILGINIIFAYSIYITAATGQLNLGGAGFQAIGAYASAILSNEMGFPNGPYPVLVTNDKWLDKAKKSCNLLKI